MSDLGHAAQARRYYHHVLNGVALTADDVARMVRTIEQLEAANVTLVEALRLALGTAESWIHDQLDGTSYLENALAELQPCRDVLEQKATKGETDE